jgi:raffinose/stachyose/melibiose transport system permease protein
MVSSGVAVTAATARIPRSRQRGDSHDSLLYPSFFILVMFVVTMLVWNLLLSFMKFPGFGKGKWVGLKNYEHIFTDQAFWEACLHSLYYVIPMAIVPCALGLFLAVAVFDLFRGRISTVLVPWVRGGFYLPQVIPIAITGTLWGWLLDGQQGVLNALLKNLGLTHLQNDWLGKPIPALMSLTVIMIWLQLGFAFVIFIAGLARLDVETVEAASVDGASWWQRFIHIALPALRPEILAVLLITVVGGLKVFAPVVYVTFGGPQGSTQSAATFAVSSFFGGYNVGGGSAVTTLLALIIGVGVSVLAAVFVRRSRSGGGQS